MILETIQVQHFRSLHDATLACDDLTVLVGRNGAGKSCFLRALELFYSPAPQITTEDFYNRDTSNEIVVRLTYRELPAAARALFKKYVEIDRLTVERVFMWNDGKVVMRYHGSGLANPEFMPIRQADGATARRSAYNDLVRGNPKYAGLLQVKKAETADEAMAKWEEGHLDACTRQRDDGQFFGFTRVAQGYLAQFTRLLLIPAVRDASEDAADQKGSALTQLVDLVVRSTLADNREVQSLKADTKAKYEKLIQLPQLKGLEDRLSERLRRYVQDSKVCLTWVPLDDLTIPLPKADVRIVEDAYEAPVSQTGHGLQRAFVLTMLESIAEVTEKPPAAEATSARETNPGSEEPRELAIGPRLILAIEEPELYQHPNRQRHFATVLRQLAYGRLPGVTDKMQVLYCTHSPLLAGVDRLEQLRVMRKTWHAAGMPKVSCVIAADLNSVVKELQNANPVGTKHFTKAGFLARIAAVMTPWVSEGFFADIVVLVEGEDDRAAILGYALALEYDLESMGCAVIPCMGKTNLHGPYAIFKQLGIPAYLLWDSDYSDEPEDADPEALKKRKQQRDRSVTDNARLLRLTSHAIEEWPAYVDANSACFMKNLDATLKHELGPGIYDKYLERCKAELDIEDQNQAIKRPAFVSRLIDQARREGHRSVTLETIVQKIVELHGKDDASRLAAKIMEEAGGVGIASSLPGSAASEAAAD